MPFDPNDLVMYGYRADPKSKTGLESKSTKFDPAAVREYLSALRDAHKLGIPRMPSIFYAGQLLQEGRNDFGYNEFNKKNPKAMDIYATLQQEPYNYSPKAAGFVAATLDKYQHAKALGIPFPVAWNGTGKTKAGRTGWDYADEIKRHIEAAQRPENKALMDLVNNTLNPAPPPPPTPPVPQQEPSWWQKLTGNYKAGGGTIENTTHDRKLI